MSLLTIVHCPTGIAMSADSRITASPGHAAAWETPAGNTLGTRFVVSDSAPKLFAIGPHCAVGYFGDAEVRGVPVEVEIDRFCRKWEHKWPSAPGEVSLHLLDHLHGTERPRPSLTLVLAGYDREVPFIFKLDVNQNTLKRLNWDEEQDSVAYGIIRGGDTDVVDRLLSVEGCRPRASLMRLQDAVDYGRFLIRTTMEQMRFEPRFPTVGGAIDTVTLESGRVAWLSRKEVGA